MNNTNGSSFQSESIIYEYNKIKLPIKSNEDKLDIDYLEEHFFKYYQEITNNIPFRGPYQINYLRSNEIELKNTSYAGIIQLSQTRLLFKPKINNMDIFQMLPYLKNFSNANFYYDPYKYIVRKDGTNFIEIIGMLFYLELKTILEKGLLKTYIRNEQNLNFLKGKLIIKNQIINEIKKTPKFNCKYFDLTYDNLENQIILYVLCLLLPRLTKDSLKNNLLVFEYQLKNEITFKEYSGRDCDKVCYNRVNEYYKNIISLSKLILEDSFVHSYASDKSIGVNFLVNMNQLYEDFLTEMIKETIAEDEDLQNRYEVIAQKKVRGLLQPDPLTIKPDIVIRNKSNDKDDYKFVIDTKYKIEDNNADYYQLIAYLLAFNRSKKGILIYPNINNDDQTTLPQDYTLIVDKIATDKKILIWRIDLSTNSKKPLVMQVKENLKIKLHEITDIA
jgi:5-methylcytosine-specific restriction enzyme subunit McrC